MDVPQQLPARRPFQSRGVGQIAIDRPQRMRRRVPAHREIARRPRQEHNADALVQRGKKRPVEHINQDDAEQYAGGQKRNPGDRTNRPTPGRQRDDNDQRRGHR